MNRLRLACTAGPHAGQNIQIDTEQQLFVGRTDAAQWSFANDREMSSRHFLILCRATTCAVHDLDSTNGTFVNGVRIADATLVDGDELRAGLSTFLVSIETATLQQQASQRPSVVESENRFQAAAATGTGGRAIEPVTPLKSSSEQVRVPESPPENSTLSPTDQAALNGPPSVSTTPFPSLPVSGASGAAAIGLVTIEVIRGLQTGQQSILRSGQSLTFGATQAADITLPGDPTLSGVHFELRHGGDHCEVRDCNSTNGIQLNDVKVRRANVNSGDLLVAGNTRLRVEFEQPTAAAQQARTGGDSARDAIALSGTHLTPEARNESVAPPAVPEQDAASLEPAMPLLELVNQTMFPAALLPWENLNGEARLTVIVKATFAVDAKGNVTIADEQLPLLIGDVHYGDDPMAPVQFESDMVPFKPKADVVLVGHAWPQDAATATQLDVRLRVGPIHKTLRVFGDRHWHFPRYMNVVPAITAPQPFERMPLTYDRAFGGIDPPAAGFFSENLQGTGFIGAVTPKSVHEKKLPNIEDPQQLITACEICPRPMGFGFYGRGANSRVRYAGTYDDRYRAERAPLLPIDFSHRFHNGAHPDLQVDGYLQGGEVVELDNLTAEPQASFCLPTGFPQIAITRFDPTRVAAGPLPSIELQREPIEDQPVRPFLDTLVLMPDQRRFYMVYRAVFPMAGLEQIDIARIRVSQSDLTS